MRRDYADWTALGDRMNERAPSEAPTMDTFADGDRTDRVYHISKEDPPLDAITEKSGDDVNEITIEIS